MSERELQERTAKIIRPLVPPDAEERVLRSFKQANQTIREQIRNATGLKLAGGEGNLAIPVKVVDGFPIQLARLIDEHHDPILWRLILGQPKIGGLVEGADFLLKAWSEIEQWPKLPAKARRGRRPLERCLNLGIMLQNVAIAERVRKQMRKISEDILGAYRFSVSNVSVELYWIPIAMVAAILDVRIEDLTLVVLIHELAHGYTHIGRDIDGKQWDTQGFGMSCLDVVEGLAQFYTHVITDDMAERMPGPRVAYERFLTMQSGPYLAHRKWLERDSDRRGEIVRLTMIAARTLGSVDQKTWNQQMNRASKQLAGRSTTKPVTQKQLLADNF